MSFDRRYNEERGAWWIPDAVGVFQTKRQRIMLVLIGIFMFIAAIASLVIFFLDDSDSSPSPSPSPSPTPTPTPSPSPSPSPSPAPAPVPTPTPSPTTGNYDRGYFLPALFGGSILVGLLGVLLVSVTKLNFSRILLPIGAILFITTVVLFIIRESQDTDLTQFSFFSTGVDVFVVVTAYIVALFIGTSLIPAIEASSAVTNSQFSAAFLNLANAMKERAIEARERVKKVRSGRSRGERSEDGDDDDNRSDDGSEAEVEPEGA
nr:hypothetical protein [Sicyoidochytrium minutum DNA virus]